PALISVGGGFRLCGHCPHPSDLTPSAQDFILSKLAVNKKVLAINMAIQLVVYRSLKLKQSQNLLDE
ncbi:MAG: hypothetical protein ACREBG_03785, partial [Pyrinomonadaceae bacterium]